MAQYKLKCKAMKKNTLFGIVLGTSISQFCINLGYGVSDLMFWAIDIPIIIIFAIIYHKCKS